MEELFFNKGFNKRSDSFGTGRKARFVFQKACSSFLDKHVVGQKNAPQRFLATIANLPNNAWVQNNLDLFLAQ